ncbi:MAG: hypothetical protein A2Y25_09050 [Candidatus Melainabacteria bacterium GWF2_37_15]|nr:MAG: hypothetical protein A2Y25_09050 [Candidatus Melainabacteria bacterium GWF2_37_15]
MEVRQAALNCLVKILEHNNSYDETLELYAGKVDNPSDLTNTVASTVKFKLALDYFIEQVSTRKIKKLSPVVRNLLRLGIFELEYLKRPDYAVVNSYVDLCRKLDKNSASFVNAILRNFIRKRAEISIKDEDLHIKYSHPKWLVDKWVKNYGIESAIKIMEYNNRPPKIHLRINTLKTDKIDIPENPQGNIKNLPGYKEGYWVVQGESSAMVAPILDPQPGEKILDLCAAPGAKTTHIASLMGDKGEITAVDISPKRLERIKENCERLGIKSVKIVAGDAAEIRFKQEFDRILVDAPCSNTGVFGKRPDARWNRKPEDITNLADLQLKILNNAATMLKSGGVLVYSTCSIEPEEDQEVIQKFLETNENFKLEFSRLILQSECDIDGFFIAKLLQSQKAFAKADKE